VLAGLGLASRSRAIERLAAGGMAIDRRVVLAGVADLPPVLERALAGVEWVSLIAAPREEAATFDAIGRPLEVWNGRELEWPGHGEVCLCADPRQQAAEAVRMAAAEGSASDALALGSADDETAAELEQAFTRAGWPAHNPAGGVISPESGWFAAWRAFLLEAGAAEAVDLLGWPCTGAMVGRRRVQRVRALCAVRDRWLARGRDDLVKIEDLDPRDADAVTLARETLEVLEKWRGGFLRGDFVAAMERLLERIDPDGGMGGVRAWLEEMAPLIPGVRRGAAFWLELMIPSLGAGSREAPGERVIDVHGWLELPFEPGRHLIACGLNEQRVPAPVGGDTWLPDGARRLLGLTTDESRAARDAFLLRSMIEARRAGGRVDLLLAKSSGDGDALLPSRVLLAAPESELPGRVRRLFAELEPPDAGLAWVADWKWRPRAEEVTPRLSVTALRDYLACPFRFYIKHVVGGWSTEPERVEWNPRDFGNIAHEVLENWGRDEEAREFSKTEELEKWLHCELDRVVGRRFAGEPPLAVRIQSDGLRQRLSWFARVQACERAAGWRVESVEEKFERQLGGFTVVGKVDRIDRDGDGRRRVIDYKTFAKRRKVEGDHRTRVSASTVRPAHLEAVDEVLCEDAKGKPLRWTNLQVPLYSWFLGPVEELGYFVIGATEGEVGLELWNGFSEADTESARKCAAWVIGCLRERVFWPPADKVKYDDCSALAMGRPLRELVEPGGFLQ
jgi:ATP-dependent helicase/nuclease subunit B